MSDAGHECSKSKWEMVFTEREHWDGVSIDFWVGMGFAHRWNDTAWHGILSKGHSLVVYDCYFDLETCV